MNNFGLRIIDNFLSEKNYEIVINHCLSAKYKYGEVDIREYPPTGMICEICPEDEIYNLFSKEIELRYKELTKNKIYRMYINCFAPNENPYFHPDAETGVTALFYPTINWNINEGGETQFLIDGNIVGILPIPNRILLFDANILHRATSFRSNHRFSIAIKYENR